MRDTFSLLLFGNSCPCTFVLNHATVTAQNLIKTYGYSHATASKHLKDLAEVHGVLDYRWGDKRKQERPFPLLLPDPTGK
ncbi:MAG: hypothetical protein ACE5OZ_13885 [Candidatus Heimdallarchaeota archaeon]